MSFSQASVARPSLVAHRYSLWAGGGDLASSFDGCGRLLTARIGPRFLRRGLDGTLVELRRDPGGPWPWATTRLADHGQTLDALCARLRAVPQRGATPRALRLLDQALRGLAERFASDTRDYARVLGSVPIIPPNHARSVYLRLTEGCQYDGCRFCTLYAGTPFRARPIREMVAHAREVLRYFGDGAGVRPAIYIGDASVLEAGVGGFIEALAALHDEVEIVDEASLERDGHAFKRHPFAFEGIYGFADVPRAARLAPEEVREMARLGVRRLYLGVESGHAPLLRRVRKPHSPEQVLEAVRRLHAGGVAAGIILLVGAGGRAFVDPHLRDSANLVAALDPHPEDFLFLSPLDAQSRAAAGASSGEQPLDDAELARETRRLRAALQTAAGPDRRLRVADYLLESFVY